MEHRSDVANNLKSRDDDKLRSLYGVNYYETSEKNIVHAEDDDLYHYTTYIGQHEIQLERGDCIYFVSDDRTTAHLKRGPQKISSTHIATVIRGYMPEEKSSTFTTRTNLPYVNGCSTKQIFSPDRPGDPTLQLLQIPPFSSEQAHHIHSTVRVAYIVKGSGRSIVGMEQKNVIEDLYPGKVCILQKMCPHHFETDHEHLLVLPLHIFSSVGAIEQSHPMFNGTHMTG